MLLDSSFVQTVAYGLRGSVLCLLGMAVTWQGRAVIWDSICLERITFNDFLRVALCCKQMHARMHLPESVWVDLTLGPTF